MDIKTVERKEFHICGYAVETTAKDNDRDIAQLYDAFFHGGREAALLKPADNIKGFYGLSWYTVGHERYCYLLGREVTALNLCPKDALIKTVPPTVYAVASCPTGEDIKEVWTQFFYTGIPNLGYAPNEEHGYYFEYYPGSVYGAYELWVPVVKANV